MRIAGVDEAGRGPLAGPVVAATCFFTSPQLFYGIDDSKKLTAEKRKDFFVELTQNPEVHYGVGIVSSEIIDSINIYQATILAMKEAILSLKELPDFVLVDGNIKLKLQDIEEQSVIKGGMTAQVIAAASIIAKETRDKIMVEYHAKYPQYGFDKHKGYGTEYHLEALRTYGPTPIHRRSFQPVGELV